MKHYLTPYEQFLCDDTLATGVEKDYPEHDEVAHFISDIDCPDCMEIIEEIVADAVI